LALLLTLAATAADQFAAPILYTTSPLWATAACLLLIWRHGQSSLSVGDASLLVTLSKGRLALFLAAHVLVVLAAHSLTGALQPLAGAATVPGALFAVAKLSVLLPTLFLFPPVLWGEIMREYSSECIAALVVLITFFPRRALEALWPFYGQVLGRFVFLLARLAVPGLGYVKTLTPTLTGPDLDVTIIPECSGINGLELFDLLFAFVAICDWNRLRKGRALFAYFVGLAVMLLSNGLRITSLVVLGNRGFVDDVSRFHISAGWVFFVLVFLVCLALVYRWMVKKSGA
jgi:exosortase/archaeosortase family protein